MASFDGAYDSLTQGVSQQVPTSRLGGQVTEQINMVSDVVTGVRRRVGAKLRFTMKSNQADDRLIAWKTDVGGIPCECYLNTVTGELIMLEEGNVTEMVRFQSDYLRATSPYSIRHTGVGDSLFIANIEQVPFGKVDDGGVLYRTGGFVDVQGSALNQKFEVTVDDGENFYTGYFTTPDGKEASHAQYVAPAFITERLAKSLQGENMIFPPSGKKNPVQDKPYPEENGASLDGGYYVTTSNNNSFTIARDAGAYPQDFVIDMPDGYINVTKQRPGLPGRPYKELKFTILKATPGTTYRIIYKGKPWTYKVPTGEVASQGEYMTVKYITDALKSSAEGYDMIVPPVRWEEESGKPSDPPVIHVDPNNTFNEHFEVVVSGSQLFIKSKQDKPIRVISGTAKIYLETSVSGLLPDVSKLPSTLPQSADGLVLAIGKSGQFVTYYRYDAPETRWRETAKPGSITSVANVPVEIYWDGEDWKMSEEDFTGRLSGDDETNPDPEFIDWGITGISSYQGRLVIMSGSWVYLSATNAPKQFYRSTVEELLDSDPIGIGSSSAGSANFQYGVVFNKDLLLFSPEHQALIPGLNQALTPKNAHILVTSTYTADMLTSPVTLGSSVMYPFPRSSKHFGILEMIPSVYTDSMYSSVDASEHIPRYMEGRCRFMVASTVSNLVVFGSTTNRKVLYAHEYMWSGEEKVLKSWHRWEFPANVAHAFFTGELINVLFVDEQSGTIFVTSIDPKAVGGSEETYFLDYYTELPVQREGDKVTVEIPTEYSDYMVGKGLDRELKVAYAGGDLDSTEIGSEVCPECKTITLNPSTTAQRVVIGVPYRSQLTPSPPTFRDYKERPIVFNKVQLMKMYVRTNRTGEFEVQVRDKPRGYVEDIYANPVRWLSRDLNLGKLPVGGLEGNIIPCRVDASSGEVDFISRGLNELNIVTIEYTCRGSQMRQRR